MFVLVNGNAFLSRAFSSPPFDFIGSGRCEGCKGCVVDVCFSSRRLGEVGEDNFERVVTLVGIAHHTQVVSRPQGEEVDCAVSANPRPVVCEIVVTEDVHIVNHPLHTLTVASLPGAVTAALLGPQVNHLASVVGGVGNRRGNSE